MSKLTERARERQVGTPGRGRRRRTSTPSRPSEQPLVPRRRATSSGASGPSSAGTPRSWWSRPTSTPTASAATSPRSPPRPRSTRSASTTSSGARTTATPATTSTSRATPRPGIYARAFLEGRLDEAQLDHFRREIGRRRACRQLPAPAAHARLLGVPDGVDGPRPDQLDLPGPLQPLPPQPPHRRHQRSRGCGASSATASATSPRRSAPSPWPAASGSTTSPGSSTATCSASTARCGATARSSRSSRPSSAAPAGTSSRSSGARAGTSCWPSDVDGVLLDKMNTTVDGEFQRYAVESRRLHPRALLRPRPPAAQAGRAPQRRGPARPAPRRPRLPEALRRLQGRHRAGAARRRSSWPRRSRAGRSGPTSRAATPPTRSRR